MHLNAARLAGAALIVVTLAVNGQSAGRRDSMVPRFGGLDLPEPPQQKKGWPLPATALPTNLISAVQFLVSTGFADPRGCEYREFEAVVGSVWGNAKIVKEHGWVIPHADRRQSFVVSWAGTIYPALRIGEKADLRGDVEQMLRADQRSAEETARQPAVISRRLIRALPEWLSISATDLTMLKVAPLLLLGEDRLAERYWNVWRRPGLQNQSARDEADPFRELAYQWAWVLFDRAVCAHMRGDDNLALPPAD